ncbi:hypothetical protein [Legionella parisiensis]|uniref:Uncharacterized protein n=2 Tax=Legionella parisiensis TaxID=45071 RepID=A0A1E5JR49_9GAMM|nr:hypothetical protein [Legionella parisiensis]KTD44195.1 hypothetical protein Lpar_0281 [Legionella parisiensis]OEH47011.1 hypothetical protein lpari_01988 [Legionella parisiensis]STX71819.1 Uncharacterised protein [Legionella parisiensis]
MLRKTTSAIENMFSIKESDSIKPPSALSEINGVLSDLQKKMAPLDADKREKLLKDFWED